MNRKISHPANDRSESEEMRRLFNRERFLDEVALTVYAAMEREGLSRSELAARLGVSKPMVTKILSGANNFRLETLADCLFALGYAVHLDVDRDAARIHHPAEFTVDYAGTPYSYAAHVPVAQDEEVADSDCLPLSA